MIPTQCKWETWCKLRSDTCSRKDKGSGTVDLGSEGSWTKLDTQRWKITWPERWRLERFLIPSPAPCEAPSVQFIGDWERPPYNKREQSWEMTVDLDWKWHFPQVFWTSLTPDMLSTSGPCEKMDGKRPQRERPPSARTWSNNCRDRECLAWLFQLRLAARVTVLWLCGRC